MASTAPSAPGRPRDPQKDVDVLAATRELLVEVGYQATTIVAVARRAGVGAPTIYRRWPHREALIEDAAFGEVEQADLPKPSGDLRTDLRAWTQMFAGQFADPVTRAAIPGLLMAYQHDASLYDRLVNRSENDVRGVLTEVLRHYLNDLPRKDLAGRADAVFDFLVATTAIHTLTVGAGDQQAFCDRTADALTALAYSSWTPGRGRGAAAGTR